MALVVCPECKKEISEYAESCPACGFPIKEFMINNGLTNTNKLMICPKCAHTYAGFGKDSDPIYLKCKFCNINIVQTNLEWKEYCKIYREDDKMKLEEKYANLYGNNQFSQEAYEHRISVIAEENREYKRQREQQNITNTPKCPKCGCTEFVPLRKKFSLLTGFATNKVEMVCKNCGAVKK